MNRTLTLASTNPAPVTHSAASRRMTAAVDRGPAYWLFAIIFFFYAAFALIGYIGAEELVLSF